MKHWKEGDRVRLKYHIRDNAPPEFTVTRQDGNILSVTAKDYETFELAVSDVEKIPKTPYRNQRSTGAGML